MAKIGYETQDQHLAMLLQAIQVQDIGTAIVRAYGAGGVDVGRMPQTAAFIMVTQGAVTMDCPELEAQECLTTGDFLLLSSSYRYTISTDGYSGPLRSVLADAYSSKLRAPTSIRLGHSGDPSAIWMIGVFSRKAIARIPLFAAMPPISRRRAFPPGTTDFTETDPHSLGSAETIRRFVDLHVAQLVREYALSNDLVRTLDRQTIDQARVTSALHMIDREPQRNWSVDHLARAVGMSRSAFSAAFTTVTGTSAMTYVTGVRMARAAVLIKTGTMPILAVAQAAGYGSEAAFSKAFKRKFGVAPRVFRNGQRPNREPQELLAPWDPFLF